MCCWPRGMSETSSNMLGDLEEGPTPSRSESKASASQESILVSTEHYPMQCLSVQRLMQQEVLTSHGELTKLQHLETVLDEVVHFISHQWLGYKHPDPHGVQLRRMKHIFQQVTDGYGQSLFSEENWCALCDGFSKSSAKVTRELEQAALSKAISSDVFLDHVRDGYVWIDFCCIPQLTDREESFREDEAMSEKLADNLAAVNSIPAYVERCNYFWILAPTAEHADSKQVCDFNSWRNRGWCRSEEWANALAINQKMPLVVTSAAKIETVGIMDYTLSLWGRQEKAPCNGEFTCCKMGHRITLQNGQTAHIPCDKTKVLPVLKQLYEAKLDFFREGGQRVMYELLLALGLTIYANQTEENGTDPYVECTLDDFLPRCLFKHIDDTDELGNTPLHMAMLTARPELIQRIVEIRPELISMPNKLNMIPLTNAIYRLDGYLPSLLADERFAASINVESCAGVSLLDRAAGAGFDHSVRLLLQHRANVHTRRKDNGFTPLLSAAEHGYVECCRILLEYGSDRDAKGYNGETALELAAQSVTVLGSNDANAKPEVIKCLQTFKNSFVSNQTVT